MKQKVQTFIHLSDSKGWNNTLKWNSSESPPRIYRIRKKVNHTLNCEDIENIPKNNDDLDFIWKSEKIESLNDKFYNHHIYYEERW
jgi:hypothetical protein